MKMKTDPYYRRAKLLEVLNADDYVSADVIFEAIPEYKDFDDSIEYVSVRRNLLIQDVYDINNNPDVEQIICQCYGKGYKIATLQEAADYEQTKRDRALNALKYWRTIQRKLSRNNQYKFDFENEEISRVIAVLEREEK